MKREQAEKLLGALICDDLDAPSRAELLAYLETDDDLREQLADLRMSIKVTADALQHEPAPVLSQERLNLLQNLAQGPAIQRRIITVRRCAAVAAVLMVGVLTPMVFLPQLKRARTPHHMGMEPLSMGSNDRLVSVLPTSTDLNAASTTQRTDDTPDPRGIRLQKRLQPTSGKKVTDGKVAGAHFWAAGQPQVQHDVYLGDLDPAENENQIALGYLAEADTLHLRENAPKPKVRKRFGQPFDSKEGKEDLYAWSEPSAQPMPSESLGRTSGRQSRTPIGPDTPVVGEPLAGNVSVGKPMQTNPEPVARGSSVKTPALQSVRPEVHYESFGFAAGQTADRNSLAPDQESESELLEEQIVSDIEVTARPLNRSESDGEYREGLWFRRSSGSGDKSEGSDELSVLASTNRPDALVQDESLTWGFDKDNEKSFEALSLTAAEPADDDLADNIQAIIKRLEGSLERGRMNIRSIYVKTTMGPSHKIL